MRADSSAVARAACLSARLAAGIGAEGRGGRYRSWCSAILPRRPLSTALSLPSRRFPEIDVNLIYIPGQSDYRKRLGADFAAGTPADIMLINYRRYASFAVKGVLEPLGPYLEKSRSSRRRLLSGIHLSLPLERR